MKKLILAAVIGIFSITAFGQKVAHINSQEILLKMPEYAQGKEQMTLLAEQAQKKLETIYRSYQEKENTYKKNSQDPAYPSEILEMDYKELIERQQKLQSLEMDEQNKLQQKEVELMQKMEDKIKEICAVVAKEKGLLYILDVNSVFYAGGEDVSKLVLAKLGVTESN